MTLTRRRFLTISAAMAATPANAATEHWQGRALGAEVSLTVRGPRDAAAHAIAETRMLLGQIEIRANDFLRRHNIKKPV